jgi:predicted kinase
MSAIIFCGLQGSGKSTFYFRRFAESHVRINQDMLKTGNRQDIILHACLAAQQPFVVDNAHPLAAQRRRIVALAKASGFWVEGYYFEASVEECIERSAVWPEAARVPAVAIRGTAAKFQVPAKEEGYDALFRVRVVEGEFQVEEWG